MYFLKNHNGSSLLLTLVLVILFSVLGLSLLSLSISGSSKNNIRQDTVSSYDLSQKGTDYLVNKIEYEIKTELGENGLAASTYVSKLEAILNKYKCSNLSNGDKSRTVTTGNMEYCIENYSNKIDPSGKENVHRKVVNIKSIGTSGKVNKNMLHEIEIGADSIPDFLNYVIGTNKLNDGYGGDGNLYLHGGVEIQGDMKVEGDLITYDKGYGGGVWVNSVYPRALGYNSEKSKIVLKGSAYYPNQILNMNDHLARINFRNNSNYSQFTQDSKLNMAMYFNPAYAPEIVNRSPVKTKIEITDYEKDMKYEYNSNKINVTHKYVETNNLNEIIVKDEKDETTKNMYLSAQKSETITTQKCDSKNKNCKNVTEIKTTTNLNPNIVFEGTNNFRSLSTNSNVDLKTSGDNLSLLKDSNDKGGTAYIGGNLSIGNGNETNPTKDDAKNELVGTYYVNGNLTIQGSELSANAVIYVKGNVNIRFSSIRGKSLGNEKKGSLIIFSKGNIFIANISAFEAAASEISAYFYTEKNFEMYGTGSNIFIKGGISARRIALHGVRGTSKQGSQIIYDNQYTQEGKTSRLRVYFNSDIITTYSDLRQKEPIIYQIDPSKTINRK